MKSLVFQGTGQMALEERGRPEAGAHEVLCRVLAAGICGSELEAYQGFSKKRHPPLVFGHELVVEVVDGRPGGRFVVNPLRVCGVCAACLADRGFICENRQLISLHLDGGQSEFIAIPTQDLIRWDGDDIVKGVLAEPAATAFHALSIGRPLDGATVTVIGCGAMGLLTVQLARILGAGRVLAFDPLDERKALAVHGGAEVFDEDLHAGVADLVVDSVGSEQSRATALRAVRTGGILRLIGLRNGESLLSFSDVVGREITVQGVYAYTRSHLERATRLLNRPSFDAEGLVTRFPLSEGVAAYAELVEHPESYVKIALVPEVS